MLRILRAFAWIRWRVLLNSLERTSARDTLERLSLAIEQLGPLLAGALLVPSAMGLAGLAAVAGYMLASGGRESLAFEVLRYVLLGATAFCIAGPILLPGVDRSNAVRLLLLPISRRLLYVAQTAGGIMDPWILLVLPVVFALPLGLAAGGALTAASVAAVSGLVLLVVLLGLSSLAGLLLQLVVRNRRRGELIALLFIVCVPVLAVVPGIMDVQQRRAEREGGSVLDQRTVRPAWIEIAATEAFAFVPSELHTSATRVSLQGFTPRVAGPIAILMVFAGLLHGAALLVFGRLLDSPWAGGRRGGADSRVRMPRLPGLSAGASAVALAQVRLALRTPRGRSILLSPPVVTAMFGFLMMRGGDLVLGFVTLRSGLGLAVFGAAVSLVSILPLAMNQFATDRSGLTLTLLSPLQDIDLLIGKLAGNAMIAALPALVCVAGSALLMPDQPLVLWIVLVPALASTYCMAAPVAAVLSAALPRAVDLNSIGSRSNAHGLAGLLGLAAFAAAAVPPISLTLLAIRVLERPSLAFWLSLAWCLVAMLLCRVLLSPASAFFSRRRENLALVAAADR